MILKSRLFHRIEASRDAKTVYIFCEGERREFDYFQYFREIDSRINVEVHKLQVQEDHSPTGLFAIAEKELVESSANPNPKFEFIEDLDEVWFVIDTDCWGDKIETLRKCCTGRKGWKMVQSNPCFEVWLYYHFEKEKPSAEIDDRCKEWKKLVDGIAAGGFDSRKHPVLIEDAVKHSKQWYEENGSEPKVGCTQVFDLGISILSLAGDRIRRARRRI